MRGSLIFRPIACNPTSTHYLPCSVTSAVNEYLCDTRNTPRSPLIAWRHKRKRRRWTSTWGSGRQSGGGRLVSPPGSGTAASDVAGHRDEMDRAASRLPSAASRVQRWRRRRAGKRPGRSIDFLFNITSLLLLSLFFSVPFPRTSWAAASAAAGKTDMSFSLMQNELLIPRTGKKGECSVS